MDRASRRAVTISLVMVIIAAIGVGAEGLARSAPPARLTAARVVSTTSGCPPSVRSRFIAASGRPTATSTVVITDGLAVCEYRATRVRAGHCAAVRVSVDTAPSAYRDFQRWVVETAQTADQSSHASPGLHPVTVNRLGVEADWVASDRLLGAATLDRWVSVVLQCRLGDGPGLALATSIGRAALG
jgi:hypothetical protein